jgi:RimJ/RimL family protein N-acetyltransferase
VPEHAEDWLLDRPAECLAVGDLVVRRASTSDVDDLVVAVNESLAHLRPWMPWAQLAATPESIGAFLRDADAAWSEDREFQYSVRHGSRRPILGFFGLHARLGPHALEIGYWLHVDHVGRGTATSVAEALTVMALSLGGVDRVEIRCDAANVRSAAIPARLGYHLGTIEHRTPEAPGETGQLMIWVQAANSG